MPTYSETLETALINIIKEVYNDKNDIISWWNYEMDFGSECDDNSIRDKNNTPIPYKTA